MFLQFYGLAEQPFGVTPDPRFFYSNRNHEEALGALLYGIENDLGFTALVAEPGLGKTTLLFRVLEAFRDEAVSAFVFEPQNSSAALLRCLLNEWNVTPKDSNDPVTLQQQFRDVLVSAARAGRRVIVVLDEAQNLKLRLLEAVRLLSNFESRTAKLLHIILAGQPPLAEVLARPDMAQLRQRLSKTCWLRPLSECDTAHYIDHRLRVGGYRGEPLFSEAAVRVIAVHSGGVPRNINRICFDSLSLGYALEEKPISKETVERALSDPGTALAAREHGLSRSRAAATTNGKVAEPLQIRSEEGHRDERFGERLDRGSSRHTETEEIILHERALVMREKAFGPNHPKVATTLTSLAVLHRDQGRREEAQKLMARAVFILERAFGPRHPKTALRLSYFNSLFEVKAGDRSHPKQQGRTAWDRFGQMGAHNGHARRRLPPIESLQAACRPAFESISRRAGPLGRRLCRLDETFAGLASVIGQWMEQSGERAAARFSEIVHHAAKEVVRIKNAAVNRSARRASQRPAIVKPKAGPRKDLKKDAAAHATIRESEQLKSADPVRPRKILRG